MKPACTIFLMICVFAQSAVLAQSDSSFFTRASVSVGKWQAAHPIEKVHLQTDKPYYAAGDDIWFKAYVTSVAKHTLSTISGILNVELISNKDSVSQFIKLPLVNGLTWGDFKLPDTLKAGIYRIRAYTNWMRNAGEEYFFEKTINIGNTMLTGLPQTKVRTPKVEKNGTLQVNKTLPQSMRTNIQFFPEGGNMVFGVGTKLGFKAIGDDGLGKEISGQIVDAENHKITKFRSQHLGMGQFDFLPDSTKTYKANITYADGSQNTVNLPIAAKSGYLLQLDNTDPLNFVLKIDASKNILNKNEGINLIAQQSGQIYYAAKSKLNGKAITAVIPKNRFPAGVIQFTLFSTAGEPLNERLVFVNQPSALNLSVSSIKPVFATREKVDLNILSKDGGETAVQGNFSVSVTDETKVPVNEANEHTIISDLLLTSDIKGYVEQPGYYFLNGNEHAAEDLDLLMLTQGYHLFEWIQILKGDNNPTVFKPENSLQIAGFVKTPGGKPVVNGKVALLSQTQGFFMMDTLTNQDGHFAFDNLQFRDSVSFIVQSKTKRDGKNVKIVFDKQYTDYASNIKNMPVTDPSAIDSMKVYLANNKNAVAQDVKYGIGNHVHVLKEVKISDKKIQTNSSNLNGPGNADQVVLAKEFNKGCPTIINCLGGTLRGIFIQYDIFGDPHPCIYLEGKPVNIKVMLDGIIVDDNTLNSLPPEIVESVELLKSSEYTSIYGQDAYNGLILINTKKGALSDAYVNNNIRAYYPKGYYKARTFYAPQYDDPKSNTALTDFRSTIYWNPNVVTDKSGKASFNFFNADAKGTYRVVVEGIDINGNPGRQVYRYKVE